MQNVHLCAQMWFVKCENKGQYASTQISYFRKPNRFLEPDKWVEMKIELKFSVVALVGTEHKKLRSPFDSFKIYFIFFYSKKSLLNKKLSLFFY